jgi:demethylmenaquinone methyltransferase/2-methoxy-6-polyprenyl-1,4-benzoquinol methylase
MSLVAKTAFFDGIAPQWDGWEDLSALGRKLAVRLDELGLGADETVLDIGCGTGNLTRALLDKLSARGRVVAVDISPRMVEVARGKIADARVEWHVGDAARLPMGSASCDRVMCYSVWPHFEDHGELVLELARVLRPAGLLHVWHLMGRDRVNEIHAGAGEAVRADILAPASETADLLERGGFNVSTCVDGEDVYLVTAAKSGK